MPLLSVQTSSLRADILQLPNYNSIHRYLLGYLYIIQHFCTLVFPGWHLESFAQTVGWLRQAWLEHMLLEEIFQAQFILSTGDILSYHELACLFKRVPKGCAFSGKRTWIRIPGKSWPWYQWGIFEASFYPSCQTPFLLLFQSLLETLPEFLYLFGTKNSLENPRNFHNFSPSSTN